MPIESRMDIFIWHISYNKIFILYTNKEGQILPCNTMHESHRHSIEQKKQDTEKYFPKISFI